MPRNFINSRPPHHTSVLGTYKLKRSEYRYVKFLLKDPKGEFTILGGRLADKKSGQQLTASRVGVGGNELTVDADGVRAAHTGKSYILAGPEAFIISLPIKAHFLARRGRYQVTVGLYDGETLRSTVSMNIKVKQHPRLSKLKATQLTRPSNNLISESINGAWDNSVAPSKSETPVVMAVWRRIDRLPITIADLEMQDTPVRLILWINNKHVLSRAKKIASRANIPVRIYSSVNIGGFGRFYAARDIALAYKKVVFIDDDQRLKPDSVTRLKVSHTPCSVVGDYAFRFTHPTNYWWRERAAHGEDADYIGTGGMIVDTKLFQDNRLFSDIPMRYWFVEDLWISWFADQNYGYEVRCCEAGIEIDIDDKNQYSSLVDTKIRFYNYLWRQGARWSSRLRLLRVGDRGPEY